MKNNKLTVYTEGIEFVIYDAELVKYMNEPDRTSDDDSPYSYTCLQHTGFNVYDNNGNDITEEYEYLPDNVIDIAEYELTN
jgi:hypothetical protein